MLPRRRHSTSPHCTVQWVPIDHGRTQSGRAGHRVLGSGWAEVPAGQYDPAGHGLLLKLVDSEGQVVQ